MERIAHKHASLFVEAAQYAVVGKYLMMAIGLVLGDALTPEVAEAWTAAYAQLADVFVARERQLYDGNGGWTAWRRFRVARRVAHPRERRRAVQPREEAHGAREHREVVLGREVPAVGGRGVSGLPRMGERGRTWGR